MNIKVTDELVKFCDEHMLNLQGKSYLPVAARVQVFRQLNPGGTIKVVQGDGVMVAQIFVDDKLIAQDIKSIQTPSPKAKGPAAKYPMEMAATGAIGRALNLAGIGTMYGDLDEGDQIAEAPVQKKAKPNVTASDVAGIVSGV